MRTAAVALAVLALTAPAVLGGVRSSAPGWAQVAAGLRPRLEPRSANPCQRGDLTCLDVVLAEMRRRDARQASSCDHRALFTRLYLGTTEALRAAVRAGRFRDGPAIVHFAAWFARSHFQAEDDWAASRKSRVPFAWRIAFEAAGARSVHGIGDLLLGMNAHITRDLAITVAELERGRGTAVDPDYARFTDVIESNSASILRDLARRFDPELAIAQLPLALGGRKTLGQLVGDWRSEAWRNGIALRDARGPARAAAAQRIEALATERADAIVASTSYVPVVESSSSRDAYCRAHRPH